MTIRTLAAFVGGSVLWLLASPAGAQGDPVPLDRFSVQSYWAATGPGDAWMVESPMVGAHLTPTVGLSVDYAHEPFVVVRCASETNCDFDSREATLVRSLVTGQLYASIALANRFQVGLVVPLGLRSGDGFAFTRDGRRYELPGGSVFGLGDPRLVVKGRIWRQGREGASLGASAFLTGPVGQQVAENSFLGDPGLSFGAQLLGAYRKGPFTALANLGGIWRDHAQLFSTEIGPRLTYGLAAVYRLPTRLEVLGELTGSASLRAQLDENPVEGRLGVRYPAGQISLGLAAGGGILAGAGTPLFRVIGSARWTPARQDTDGDGLDDAEDACPTDPEDLDGIEDEDGCPEGDTDRDGIEDEQDRCPDQPEDVDDFEDEDGCPDEDNDGDGVRDGFDSCPNVPEDMDGDRDEDGCPDNDTDRDGIEDAKDRCPQRPEDMDGFADLDGCPERDVDLDGIDDTEDECPEQPENFDGVDDADGCPEPDADEDGIADARDRCPQEPETYDGERDEDGCPDGTALVDIAAEGIRFTGPIAFRRNRPAPRLQRALRGSAAWLRRARHLRKVEVVLSVPGTDADKLARRTEAIVRFLEQAGVERSRLVAVPQEESSGEPSLMLRFAEVVPGADENWSPEAEEAEATENQSEEGAE